MEPKPETVILGPLTTQLDRTYISGLITHLPIKLEDTIMLDLGIVRPEDYTVDHMDEIITISWSVEMKYGSRSAWLNRIIINGIDVDITFEYYEPGRDGTDDPKSYRWRESLKLEEWDMDEEIHWNNDSLSIDSIDFIFKEDSKSIKIEGYED